VGTNFIYPNEPDCIKGRILILVVKDDKFRLKCEITVRGPVLTIVPFHGKLLAGIASRVQLFRYKTEGNISTLELECEQSTNVYVIDIAVRDDFILVADLMKSVNLVLYSPQENGPSTFKVIGRDPNGYWMTSAQMFDDDYFVGSENNGHIITWRKNSGAVLPEDRDRLDVCGRINVADNVNRIRLGSLVMKKHENIKIGTTVLFAGTNGSIGVIANLDEQTFNLLDKVQKCLFNVIKPIGGLSSEEWRSFAGDKKTAETSGFIDGDLIESFFELSTDKQFEVAKEVGFPLEELHRTIETVARALH